MKNKSGIYKITNSINGKFYIGSASKFSARWDVHKHHLRYNKHDNEHLQNSWNKHGEENFKFEVVLECEKEELIYYEQVYINSLNPEYNICKVAGNTTGNVCSEETKVKIGNSRRDKKHTEESKAKMSASRIGIKRGPFSEDHIRKLSEANKGKKQTEEHIANVSKSLKGRIFSEDHKDKLSVSRINYFAIKKILKDWSCAL